MTWLLDGDKYHCVRHDETFAKTRSCPGCEGDPGPPPDHEGDEPLPPPPGGCRSTEDIERSLNADADAIGDLISRLDSRLRDDAATAGPDYHVANTIGKLYAERTKVLRAAKDCAREREHELIVKRREKREREMQRGASD